MKLLTISYILGVILFVAALMIIVLRVLAVISLNPAIPLFAGFFLMLVSKFAAGVMRRKAERH